MNRLPARVRAWLRGPHRLARSAAALVLLALLPAWYGASRWFEADLIRLSRAGAAAEVSARANTLTSAINQRLALLQGLYAFTRTEWPDATFDQPFEIYSSGFYFSSSGIRTLVIAPEGIVRYVYPLYDFQALSGYDILNDPDPDTRAAVQRAIHTREIALSSPGKLRQGGFGLTAWRAVYRGKDLWGLVAVSLDLDTVLAEAGILNRPGGLDLALRVPSGAAFSGPPAVWQQDPVIQKIILPEGAWELGGAPADGWRAEILWQVAGFDAISLALVGLIAGIVYLAASRQEHLERAVEQRTRQISAAQNELEQRVAERTRELSTLLEVSRRVSSTLALEPLLQQVLDEMQRVLPYSAAAIYRIDPAGKLAQVSAAGEANRAEASLTDEALMAQVVASLQPVIQPDWSAEVALPQAGGALSLPACWMGVPLVSKGRAMGLFVLLLAASQGYGEEQVKLALAFAQQAAVAIENAELYAQAGQVAVLEERQRLARDLHDSVSQVLYSIGLGAKTARAALERAPAQAAEAIDYVSRLAEAGQVEMRALIFELRPDSLRTGGLSAALERQAALLSARHQIEVELQVCPEPCVPLELKEVVYRVSQEATHNIVKHARATRAAIRLSCSEGQLILEVSDNGIGFDPEADYPRHLGLRSMRERTAQCHGALHIESRPGCGASVRLCLPIDGGL